MATIKMPAPLLNLPQISVSVSAAAPVLQPDVWVAANTRLQAAGIAALSDGDILLLHVVVIALYAEGVKPTYSEVHYKLKEYRCFWEVEHNLLVYYLAQWPVYKVIVDGVELRPTSESLRALVPASVAGKRRTLSPLKSVVLLQKEPEWFRGWVDLKNPCNVYPVEVWVAFLGFLRQATSVSAQAQFDKGVVFKPTRYAVAKSIHATGPPILRKMRLGELAHLVQLAIQEGFLCYESNVIQPVWTSQTAAAMRDYWVDPTTHSNDSSIANCCVQAPQPTCGAGCQGNRTKQYDKTNFIGCSDEIASTKAPSSNSSSSITTESAVTAPSTCISLEELRDALKRLLNSDQPVLLSQLRVMLQQAVGKPLIPWTLGHTKLSRLLTSSCSDVCELIRQGGRHVFVKRGGGSSATVLASAPEIARLARASAVFQYTPTQFGFMGSEYWGDADRAREWNIEDIRRLEHQYRGIPGSLLLHQSRLDAAAAVEILESANLNAQALSQSLADLEDIRGAPLLISPGAGTGRAVSDISPTSA